MGDILSQHEIDALLNAMNEGSEIKIEPDSAAHVAKSYDFKTPSKFNKDQLRTLDIIFENYVRLVSSFLSGYLRTTVQMEVADTSQIAFKEFSNSLFNTDVIGIINMRPLMGSILLEISPSIGYAIIDRILGGPGLGLTRIRDFSEIEKVLLERVLNHMIGFLPEPWENVEVITPKLERIESNPQFVQFINPSEIVALVTISIKIGPTEGFINFCLPYLVLEPIMDRLYTKFWFNHLHETDTGSFKAKVEAQLEKTRVTLKAVIGRTNISVNDFIYLQPGDIIPLNSYINSDIEIYVENTPRFYAKPGLSKGKNAVQITSLARKEDQP
jgi:flagellar motor switch protein FliM